MRIKPTVVALAAATALLIAGCDSQRTGGEVTQDDLAAVDAAAAVVDAAKEIPGTDNLGEPIDVSSLAGKTIYSIPIDSKAEFFAFGESAMQDVAKRVGINFVTFPADGTQTSYQQGIQQAINAGAAAILLNGPLASTLTPQIDAAKRAGIPVIPLHINDKGEGTDGLPYEAFAPFSDAARLMALSAVVDHGGDPVHALVIESSETGPAAAMVQTVKDVLTDEAPEGSTTTSINIPVPQWSSDIQGKVQSALLRDPKINAVLPIFDSMALYAAPGIRQAAATRDVPIFTFNGTPSILRLVKAEQVTVNVAENPDWLAYTNLDTAFRAILGAPADPEAAGPLRVIDSSNVDETGDPPESGKGFGDAYPGAYLNLWGLTGS